MRIVLLITVLESLAIASWLTLQRFKNEHSRTQPAEIISPVLANAAAKASVSSSLEVSRWNFINGWKVQEQADDRGLTLGTVVERAGSAPERRSFARRSHQRNFKSWSQARHD
jgi:hypothetical protein